MCELTLKTNSKIRHKPGLLRIGVGGPVGSGKTALIDTLCKSMRECHEIAVVTNDIYTREDAQFLIRSQALSAERIIGVETGGCPHTAIREDASMNLSAIEELVGVFPDLEIIFVESGGDVAAGDKIPRKGGPGITKSDLLVINKIDLAPYVGASLDVMERDARAMRHATPFIFTNLMAGVGVNDIIAFIETRLKTVKSCDQDGLK